MFIQFTFILPKIETFKNVIKYVLYSINCENFEKWGNFCFIVNVKHQSNNHIYYFIFIMRGQVNTSEEIEKKLTEIQNK